MKSGFSLVELSIVLVILGLLTGGILTGQSLIRAAELRAISTEISRYITATQTFRDKYMALPGDMRNATQFWGAQDGSTTSTGYDATCAALTTAATGTTTCNGTGDGRIGLSGGNEYERFRFWQHLANAGLIEGRYSGVRGSGGVEDPDIGVNIPSSRLSNVGYYILYITTHGDLYPGDYGNIFTIGADTAVWTLGASTFKAEELWSIDTKLDDGKPAYGRIRTRHSSAGVASTIVTSTTAATAEYNVSNPASGGAIVVIPGF